MPNLLERVRVEAKLDDVLEVVPKGLHVQVQQVEGVVHEEDDGHEEHANDEARF